MENERVVRMFDLKTSAFEGIYGFFEASWSLGCSSLLRTVDKVRTYFINLNGPLYISDFVYQ